MGRGGGDNIINYAPSQHAAIISPFMHAYIMTDLLFVEEEIVHAHAYKLYC